MASEINVCQKCNNLEVLLGKKDDEIRILNLQIQKLKAFLTLYQNQAKLCQFCSITENCNNENNCSKDHPDCKITNPEENENLACNKFLIGCEDFAEESHKNDDSLSKIHHEGDKEPSVSPAASEDYSKEYVYDENFKMYYCVSTGYYFDKNSGLFYIPEKGAYYSYDYTQNSYVLYESELKVTSTSYDCDSVLDRVNSLNIGDKEESPSIKSDIDKLRNPFQQNSDLEKDASINQDELSCGSTTDWQPAEGSNVTVKDLVRDAAEQSSGMSDYIYDEKSCMYYCKSTGYFYDPVKKLLFDPKTRFYYLYIQEKSSYEFYCKAEEYSDTCSIPKTNTLKEKLKPEFKTRKKKQLLNNRKSVTSSNDPDNVENENSSSPEEGEIFSSDSEPEKNEKIQCSPIEYSPSPACPPCIRAIVMDSTKLKKGSLILITCTGAILGRDKTKTVFVPDVGVSKAHAEIKFSSDSWKYSIEDLGSQNGTFINEVRLSEPKLKSEPHDLNHGDKLTLGFCELLIHIHEGHETCDNCEPGQVLAELVSKEDICVVVKTKEEKEKERRQEMRRLKKKYGLKGIEYVSNGKSSVLSGSGYEDKAEVRRITVGSENPYEKTEVASMDEIVPKSNKGFQMLKKLGWKEGDSLGLTKSGIAEPIPIRPWIGKAGLGSNEKYSPVQALPEDTKKLKWVKAQERYFQLTS